MVLIGDIIGHSLLAYIVVFLFNLLGNLICYLKFRWSIVTKINIIVTWSIFTSVSAALYLAPLEISQETIIIGIIVCFLYLILLLIPVIFFAKATLIRPLLDLKESIRALSNGNLAKRTAIRSKDEFGEMANDLNQVLGSLSAVLTEIRQTTNENLNMATGLSSSTQETNAASEQITNSLQSIVKDSQNLSKIIMEDTHALDNLNSTIVSINDVIEGSKGIVTEAGRRANDASTYASEAINKIQIIRDSSEETSLSIRALEDKIGEIPKIVNTIGEISEQTNLLALNAAIEAARAGESGRGFAVVSDEIRKLAEQSHAATQQISQLIGEILENTSRAVTSVENTGSNVKSGSITINNALSSLSTINNQIDKIRNSFDQLGAALRNQSSIRDKVNQSQSSINTIVESLNSSTQEIAASSEETTSAMEGVSTQAQNLSEGSENLRQMIDTFKTS